MKTLAVARALVRPLRRLEPADLCAVAAAGQTASTSTSGTPAAGDDTVGDTIHVPTTSFTLNFSRIDF